jgi:hypothetical protein
MPLGGGHPHPDRGERIGEGAGQGTVRAGQGGFGGRDLVVQVVRADALQRQARQMNRMLRLRGPAGRLRDAALRAVP